MKGGGCVLTDSRPGSIETTIPRVRLAVGRIERGRADQKAVVRAVRSASQIRGRRNRSRWRIRGAALVRQVSWNVWRSRGTGRGSVPVVNVRAPIIVRPVDVIL